MIPGTREWIVRSVQDWARDVRHGMALVTYRSPEARAAVIEELTRAVGAHGLTAEILRCDSRTSAQEFVAGVGASPADVLFILDPDRFLFGADKESAGWINYQRESITSREGVQVWWMSPTGAIAFGQKLPDIARFFLFRDDLTEEPERSSPMMSGVSGPSLPEAAGAEARADDLLARSLRAARSDRPDPIRIWLELALPAIREFLVSQERPRAIEVLSELEGLIGSAEQALRMEGDRQATETAEGQHRPTDAEREMLAEGWLVLSALYAELGQHNRATPLVENAVRIFRQLAEANPIYLHGLASALNNLGKTLRVLGRREAALERTREAVSIFGSLAQKEPQTYLPDLALSFHNLGVLLGNLGRREEALTKAEEASEIYRRLAVEQPQRYLPYLAGALTGLANALSVLERREDALAAAQQAIAIYESLGDDRAARYLSERASALNFLAVILSDLGRREEALQAIEQAVVVRRQRALKGQSALSDLSGALNNLAILLLDAGRIDEALEPATEAAAIRRKLAREQPEAYLPDLARSLGNLGSVLMQRDAAQAATLLAEAIEILTPFFSEQPGAFQSLMEALTSKHREAAERAGAAPVEQLSATASAARESVKKV